ncbi:MAG: TfoX/Sxy family protein [Polyangiaceae bacterium]
MPYDEKVADRLRAALARSLAPDDDIEEKKMFGGIAEMVNGHMCIGVLGTDLVLHVRPEDEEKVASHPHARPMDFTGRPMKGWYYIAAPGHAAAPDLDTWVKAGLAFVRAAGPKKPTKKRPMKPSKKLATPRPRKA